MKAVFIPLFIAAAVIASSQATPEQALRGMVEAWNSKNLPKAAGFVVGGNPRADFSEFLQLMGNRWPKLTVSGVKVDGAAPTRKTLRYQIKIEDQGAPAPQQESAQAVMVNGKWLIQPSDTHQQKAVIPELAYILRSPKIASDAKANAKATACLSNLKQLALAALMFASDYDDRFAFGSKSAQDSLLPYHKYPGLWTCPEDPKGTQSYTFNANLTNVLLSKIKDPAKTVMVYEGSANKLRFRHDGKAGVAFADGHAKRVTAAESKTLVWKP